MNATTLTRPNSSTSALNKSAVNKYLHFLDQSDGLHPRLEAAGAEHELAVWAYEVGMLCENGELPTADAAWLHTIPYWANTRADRQFLNRVREYEIWLDTHDGRHPRMNGVGTTYYGRSLGVWAAVTRHHLKNDDEAYRNREQRAEILRTRLPAVLDNGYRRWGERFREYIAFTLRHDRNPEVTGDPHEKQLAKWMRWQREELSYNRLTAERKAALNAALPGWSAGVDLSWEATFERYSRFVVKNAGCAPRDGTGNKLEQFLSEWDTSMRAGIASGTQPLEQVKLFLSIGANSEHDVTCRHVNTPRKRA